MADPAGRHPEDAEAPPTAAGATGTPHRAGALASCEEGEPCAICFDTPSQGLALPCACRVSYCRRCWDRALAQSFNTAGVARCPTCRAHVRVDFDADAGQLLFSQSTGLESSLLGRQETIDRLVEQARPLQVRILRAYGAAWPELAELARAPGEALLSEPLADLRRHATALGADLEGCLEKGDVIDRVVEAARSSRVLASYWAASAGEAKSPTCVCGSLLRRLVGDRERARAIAWSLSGTGDSDTELDDLLQRLEEEGVFGSYICDLCDETCSVIAARWSCEARGTTVLHATSYDVCDDCFARHVCGAAAV